MLKRILSERLNGTKNALFFLSQAPAHRRFTFNFQFLFELKSKVRLFKTVCRNFHLWENSDLFLLKFIFLFNKMLGLFDFKTS